MTAMTQQEKQHRTWKERASTELHDLADSTGKIVIVDFLLGMAMIIFTYSVAGLPLATLAGTLLAGIGFLRRPKNDVPKIALFVFLVISLLSALILFFLSPSLSLLLSLF